uniref:Uncharacterized protein n=1 Tax=Varanus komodoensis TaxID=61221 RepID=A0A8D2LRW7_VARKO
MSIPSGSEEDAAKQKARDGKMRREEVDDPQPEGKRMKLGEEGRSLGKKGAEESEGIPCPGGEASGIQAEAEGHTVSKGVYTGDVLAGGGLRTRFSFWWDVCVLTCLPEVDQVLHRWDSLPRRVWQKVAVQQTPISCLLPAGVRQRSPGMICSCTTKR